MLTNEPGGKERTDPRSERALTEYMTVLEDDPRIRGADGLYYVVSQSGKEYLVDDREQTCECADYEHRGVTCKHLRRVAFATGKARIPLHRLKDPDAVDPQLGDHVAGGPWLAIATDGGRLERDESGSRSEESDGRPDDCECEEWMNEHGLPCWPCYRAGFDSTNPDASDDAPQRHEPADFGGGESTGVQDL